MFFVFGFFNFDLVKFIKFVGKRVGEIGWYMLGN